MIASVLLSNTYLMDSVCQELVSNAHCGLEYLRQHIVHDSRF